MMLRRTVTVGTVTDEVYICRCTLYGLGIIEGVVTFEISLHNPKVAQWEAIVPFYIAYFVLLTIQNIDTHLHIVTKNKQELKVSGYSSCSKYRYLQLCYRSVGL